MTKSLTALLLGAFPLLALAAGEHSGGHGQGMADRHKDMAGMHKEMGGAHQEEASAAGKAGDPARVNRTIAIDMNDTMRFTPGQVSVTAGEVDFACMVPGHMEAGMMGKVMLE